MITLDRTDNPPSQEEKYFA